METVNNCIAVCPFCGQTFICDSEDDAHIDEMYLKLNALRKCNCAEAYAWRKKREQIELATDALDEIFKYNFDGSVTERFGESKSDEVLDVLKDIIPLMVEDEVTALSIKVSSVGKLTLSVNADGKINIKKQVGRSIEKKV